MDVKKREKRIMTKEERQLRVLMEKHQVSQKDISEVWDISIAAVGQRLKSLTPSMVQRFEDVILELSNNRSRQKVAS